MNKQIAIIGHKSPTQEYVYHLCAKSGIKVTQHPTCSQIKPHILYLFCHSHYPSTHTFRSPLVVDIYPVGQIVDPAAIVMPGCDDELKEVVDGYIGHDYPTHMSVSSPFIPLLAHKLADDLNHGAATFGQCGGGDVSSAGHRQRFSVNDDPVKGCNRHIVALPHNEYGINYLVKHHIKPGDELVLFGHPHVDVHDFMSVGQRKNKPYRICKTTATMIIDGTYSRAATKEYRTVIDRLVQRIVGGDDD